MNWIPVSFKKRKLGKAEFEKHECAVEQLYKDIVDDGRDESGWNADTKIKIDQFMHIVNSIKEYEKWGPFESLNQGPIRSVVLAMKKAVFHLAESINEENLVDLTDEPLSPLSIPNEDEDEDDDDF